MRSDQSPRNEDRSWKLTNFYAMPVREALPDDELAEVPMVGDMYHAKIYLNGFVWHNDAPKTAEYRAASELEQLHFRKCAGIRVFAGLHMVVKPVHRVSVDARAAGEDL